jgi:hypothetical protein
MSCKLLLFIVFLTTSCKNSVSINFSDFKSYLVKEEHTSVILLKSFIVNRKCDSTKQSFYANAFLCKTTVTNDTILVFSICKPPYDFLKANYKDERDLIIDSSKVLKSYPDQVFVNIEGSILKKGYRFIVADLTRLEY